ncbi:hypothetical protein BN946_scf184977.g37 [Trametes cinnabarina]|uniref:SMP-LTD domain-containing protein n=1 Tax=Pycnoporus cinnabarinus TaxID=5643 RepID=A0A060SDC4_PYCCI|nr:hypothetical protein BN946_scf184977.g37 [Trametes cinnabarina]
MDSYGRRHPSPSLAQRPLRLDIPSSSSDMATAYIFTLQPTFTQGLILGQASILLLLFLVLKYLFFDADPDRPYRKASYQPKVEPGLVGEDSGATRIELGNGGLSPDHGEVESSEWLNLFLQQVLDAYRVKLRNGLSGPEGDEVARRRVEEFANKMRPTGFLDYIKVHDVDLGTSSPRLTRARIHRPAVPGSDPVRLTPPNPHSPHPTITFTLPAPHSDFTLDIKTTSLMGSRAKLEDVPKLHELILHQIRRVIIEKGTWKVVLPGLASVSEVKEDIKMEHKLAEEAFE